LKFHFPRFSAQLSPRDASERSEKSQAPQQDQTVQILAVESDAKSRIKIGASLEWQGYRAHLAPNGRQALDMLSERRYDLVLIEAVLPDMDGLELLDEVKLRFPSLTVVVLSAVRDIEVAVDAMRRGACDYLVKPYTVERLLQTVDRAIDYRSLDERHLHDLQRLEDAVQARTEQLEQAIADLEHSYDVTLEALGDSLDLKDSETEGHSKRVTAYTIAMARALDLSPEELRVIARGAFLHDIGKMAIPDNILLKPGKLTPEEQTVMREHPMLGYRMLSKIPFLAGATDIVLAHQEYYDGNGYPAGLKGNEIPIGARIFAIADTLDSITSDRPYRKARSFDEAREEIKRCAGTQFDPRIVDVFLSIPNELWIELRKEINGKSRIFSSGTQVGVANGASSEKA